MLTCGRNPWCAIDLNAIANRQFPGIAAFNGGDKFGVRENHHAFDKTVVVLDFGSSRSALILPSVGRGQQLWGMLVSDGQSPKRKNGVAMGNLFFRAIFDLGAAVCSLVGQTTGTAEGSMDTQEPIWGFLPVGANGATVKPPFLAHTTQFG